MTSSFLPITHAEALERGWEQLDFVYIIGDAYVDHPSFGAAIISRVIESLGFSIGIISQPVADRDYMEFGKPRYAFLVTGGNIDSMVAHYTAAKRRRSDDAYTPGGKAGRRPDRATIVYSRKLRQLYPDSNIVIGGLEASLRRFAHYDYWDDAVRPSILLDSAGRPAAVRHGGKGHHPARPSACAREKHWKPFATCAAAVTCADQEEMPAGQRQLCLLPQGFRKQGKLCKSPPDSDRMSRTPSTARPSFKNRPTPCIWCRTRRCLPSPARSWTRCSTCPSPAPITRPMRRMGGVDAIKEVEFSIIQNRGCFGNCNFCCHHLPSGADRWFPAASSPSCTKRRR